MPILITSGSIASLDEMSDIADLVQGFIRKPYDEGIVNLQEYVMSFFSDLGESGKGGNS